MCVCIEISDFCVCESVNCVNNKHENENVVACSKAPAANFTAARSAPAASAASANIDMRLYSATRSPSACVDWPVGSYENRAATKGIDLDGTDDDRIFSCRARRTPSFGPAGEVELKPGEKR